MAKAMIVGGGIGGLTAAVALGRAGVEVAVFERAPELKEIGAGISLWANATRALGELGLYDQVRAAGAAEGEPGSAAGRKREVLELLSGWYEPARAAVEATGESKILRNDIYDRDPLRSWGAGRVTLLGDAAHPMTPNLGQGACQAIEDAVVLARCFGGGISPSLRLYEERRIRRTAAVVRRSRLVGRVTQLENPLLCRLRDAVTKRTSARAQLRQYEKIARYQA